MYLVALVLVQYFGLLAVLMTWHIAIDFLLLELGHSNVVLGVELWVIDWKLQTMKFLFTGRECVIVGDPSLHKSCIRFKARLKTI